ncbi:hypothetical protein BH11BAC3_BH11BAC3_16760 [soil metagenome]
MEKKPAFDELFISYLLKELNTADELYVRKAIENDPELLEKFSAYEKANSLFEAKRKLDSIDLAEERDLLEQLWKAKQVEVIAAVEVEPVVDEIALGNNKNMLPRIMRYVAVAASILIVIGIGWRFHFYNVMPLAATQVKDTSYTNAAVSIVRFEKNSSGKTREIILKDGTTVMLSNQSSISFREPFDHDRRNIELLGKALFKVSKDTTKPFTVFSGDIGTTALGTQFEVINYGKDKIITVRLLEGRVVVRSVDSAKVKIKQSYYLVPGQELVYNKQHASVIVRSIHTLPVLIKKENGLKTMKDAPSLPTNKLGEWYMFNNQSLVDIFNQLQNLFGVEIVYDKHQIEQFYFIGRFSKTDSLQYILENITKINKLQLVKDNNRYIIK